MKTKRIIAVFLLVLTMLTILPAAVFAKPVENMQAPKSPIKWTGTNEIVYTSGSVNVRKGCGKNYEIVTKLAKGDAIRRVAIGNNGWSKVEYNGHIRYMCNKYITDKYPYSSPHFPMHYYDKTATITITREKYKQGNSHHTWYYAAHITFTNHKRFSTDLAGGKWANSNGHYCWETVRHAAKRLGAVLCISGDVTRDCAMVKHGKVYNDTDDFAAPAAYNAYTGKLFYAYHDTPYNGKTLSSLVKQKKITDTFNFLSWDALLLDGEIKVENDYNYAQRVFMGTNGKAGDIWLFVTNGRKNDGSSLGLNQYQCAKVMQNKGCTFGIPLDGGKSATMVFLGKILNAAKYNEQYLLDFVYFK